MPRLTLRAGDLSAEIDSNMGAGLTDFSLRGPLNAYHPILRRAPGAHLDRDSMACFLMAPWCNRIRDASFRFDGRCFTLRSNFPDGTAIHGLVADRPWRIIDRTPVSARFSFDSREHKIDAPYDFGLTMRYELAPDELVVAIALANLSATSIPAGVGLHPFFQRRLWSERDEVVLRAQVAARYPTEGCLPVAAAAPDEATTTLAQGGPLGDPDLDDVFAGFDGAMIEWPASGVRLRMTSSPNARHFVVFTPRSGEGGAPLPWFCAEPATMTNDGFNLHEGGWADTGVQVIEPGASMQFETRFAIERI